MSYDFMDGDGHETPPQEDEDTSEPQEQGQDTPEPLTSYDSTRAVGGFTERDVMVLKDLADEIGTMVQSTNVSAVATPRQVVEERSLVLGKLAGYVIGASDQLDTEG